MLEELVMKEVKLLICVKQDVLKVISEKKNYLLVSRINFVSVNIDMFRGFQTRSKFVSRRGIVSFWVLKIDFIHYKIVFTCLSSLFKLKPLSR